MKTRAALKRLIWIWRTVGYQDVPTELLKLDQELEQPEIRKKIDDHWNIAESLARNLNLNGVHPKVTTPLMIQVSGDIWLAYSDAYTSGNWTAVVKRGL